MTESLPKNLKRYTQLSVLLDFLENKKLILLDPQNWEDKNDSLIIDEYKKRANVEKLFALCFAAGTETIHHWKTFASGSGGCCIEFNGKKLIDVFNANDELKHRLVEYRAIKDAEPSSFQLADIPFIKRRPYEPEKEYRVLWEGNGRDFYDINISLDTVNKITFSQQMPEPIFRTMKTMIERNYPDLKAKIYRSTVYENKTWIKNFKVQK